MSNFEVKEPREFHFLRSFGSCSQHWPEGFILINFPKLQKILKITVLNHWSYRKAWTPEAYKLIPDRQTDRHRERKRWYLRVLDTRATGGAMLELIGKPHIPTHVTLLHHHLRAAAAAHPTMILIRPALKQHGPRDVLPRCHTSNLYCWTATAPRVHFSPLSTPTVITNLSGHYTTQLYNQAHAAAGPECSSLSLISTALQLHTGVIQRLHATIIITERLFLLVETWKRLRILHSFQAADNMTVPREPGSKLLRCWISRSSQRQ